MLSFRRRKYTRDRKRRHNQTRRHNQRGRGDMDSEEIQTQELVTAGNESVELEGDSEQTVTMEEGKKADEMREETEEGDKAEDEGEEMAEDEEEETAEEEAEEMGEEETAEDEVEEMGEGEGEEMGEGEGEEMGEGEGEGEEEGETAEEEAEGEEDEEEDAEGEEDEEEGEDTLLGTITKTLLGTLEAERTTGPVDPKQDTILNLIKEYDFKEKNICLTKDLSSCMSPEDTAYTLGVKDGKYTRDFGENEPVLVALYMFPNPLVTGMVISDDSSQLPSDASVPAGYNARLHTRKLWVPFPGVSGVHIRINCGVIQTMTPVKMGETVTLSSPVGLAIYSGKLGNLEKYYPVEELREEEKTIVEVGTEELTVD